jgi:hypothetical protein
MTTREIEVGGWRIRLDTSGQMFGVDVPEIVYSPSDELRPTLTVADDEPVSAATLLLKAKQFDDGLVAAVELAAQQGLGRFAGKATLLRALAETLHDNPAVTPILAARRLGGVPTATPDELPASVQGVIDAFLSDEVRAKPIGFYRWLPELEAVFRQDRFLQATLDPTIADALATGLGHIPGGCESYDAIVRLAVRLTNPLMGATLRQSADERAFLPASESHEVRLFQRLYGDRSIPPGFDLMTELIRRIRTGEVRLEPSGESGWYDYQTWALESLVVLPRTREGRRHHYSERYRRQLEDLFRGALALSRETHAKQVGGGAGGFSGRRPRVEPIRVSPDLTVEPLPTVYARRAAAYRFVRAVLDEAFGDAWEQLHRLTPEGCVAQRLGGELTHMERLFDGAAAVSSRELGLEPSLGADEHRGEFIRWWAALATDADVARDVRMMVPVFYDIERRRTKVWAVLGWRVAPASVDYQTPPTLLGFESVRHSSGVSEPPPVEFHGARYWFAVPVMIEMFVSQLLDRDEFRRHCDRYRSRGAILRNLK